MALEDTVQAVKREREGLLATERGVQEARRLYSELSRQISNARARFRRKKSAEHVEVIVRDVIREIKSGNNMRFILNKEIDEALIASSTEFHEYESFYNPILKKVSSNKSIYKIITQGTGWSTKILPQIVFEEEAGNTSDYKHGILSYRLELIQRGLMGKVGKQGSGKGLKATNWWRRNVFGDESYETTVSNRIRLSNRAAPFWQLIAKGSVGLPATRPDGSYNPYPSKGYDFVDFAETRIRSIFQTELSAQKRLWEEEVRKFEEEINKAIAFRDKFDADVKNLSTDYRKNEGILQSFGERRRYIDEDRLAAAAEKYRAGEGLGKSRVNVGLPGKRIYLTLQRLEGYD
jgi:hypothetical protein